MRVLIASLCLLASFGAAAQSEGESLAQYYFAAARSNQVAVLEEFLEAGFPVDLRDPQSYTALMIAAYNGNSEAVASLLAHQADACLRDKRGNTALMGAMVKGEWDIAKRLYQQACEDKPNKAGLSLDTFAELFGQSEQLKALRQQLEQPR